MLGQAREKFNTIAGPQGGTSLNGSTLKTEAANEIQRLEDEINKFVDNGTPYTFVIG
jgi:GTPase involved in cell partitioning and DNA repair